MTQHDKTAAGTFDDLFVSLTISKPSERSLKVFTFDPSSGRLIGNCMNTYVRYEPLERGPIGGRFAVIDYDGSNKTFYAPVNLDDPNILVRGGLDPSQSDPRFHQQMVYAVASETLQRFERALGRRVRWRGQQPTKDGHFPVPVGGSQRLNLFPHAMCEANAFYSPQAHGILFGYFHASKSQPGRNLPGQTVFTACHTTWSRTRPLTRCWMASGPGGSRCALGPRPGNPAPCRNGSLGTFADNMHSAYNPHIERSRRAI